MIKYKKRIKFMSLLIITAFLILIGMNVKCSIFYDEKNIETLSTQYNKVVSNYYPRGNIYDRNGILFNNRVNPAIGFINAPDPAFNNVASAVIGGLSIDSNSTTASSCVGANGLQKAYNDILSGGTPIKVMAEVDADGNVIEKSGYQVVNDHLNQAGSLTLTLDYNLQKAFEDEMNIIKNERNYKAMTAIISDVSTGEILAMATVGKSMNMAVMSYQPGSIMKIITAAVALESGVITKDSKYVCTGSVKVGNVMRYCSNKIVHGEQTYAEAFANSCNCCFYELANKLTYSLGNGVYMNKMLEKAKEWGYAEYGEIPNNRFILDYDEHYSFVSSKIFNELDIFNAALGQGKIQASPYLINKITVGIANKGTTIVPYVVKSATDAIGNSIEIDNEKIFDLKLSAKTIEDLQFMMCLTGSEGSGSNNTLAKFGGLAGKTGTAESLEGVTPHSWFTGYFPANKPKYAMTVFIEEGGNAPTNAVYVYDKLANIVFDIYK